MSDIVIYGDIGDSFGDGLTAKLVKAQVDASKGDTLSVRINSAGGVASDGVAMYNTLRNSGKRVLVYIDGIALSAASIVAMAGDEIHMAANALMMIHKPWLLTAGSADDLRKDADTLDKVSEAVVGTYADARGIDRAEVEKMMAEETWMTAQDALDAGFATHIDGKREQATVTELTDERIAAFKRPPQMLRRWAPAAAAANHTTGIAGPQAPAKGTENPMSEKLFKLLGATDEGEALVIATEINALSKRLLSSTGAASLDAAMNAVEANAKLPAVVKEMSDQLAARDASDQEREREALIKTLNDDGKLPPKMHEWARSMPLDALKTYGQAAPVFGAAASHGSTEPQQPPVTLTDGHKQAAKLMGISDEDMANELRDEQTRETGARVLVLDRTAKE